MNYISLALASFSLLSAACAQDNILVYGNSILLRNGSSTAYLADLVELTGPRPNVVPFLRNNATTSTYWQERSRISALAGTWKAMVVQGNTYEVTQGTPASNPALFQTNMSLLAGELFNHSPQALFVGHETGADHPTAPVYPVTFPNPATWLAYSQLAYQQAAAGIAASYPNHPAPIVARQGSLLAEIAGYELTLFESDLHHLSAEGVVLCACLHYLAIYGGRICDLPVDYAQPSALVQRMQNRGVTEAEWRMIAGLADRFSPSRPLQGSSSDFQLRMSVNVALTNLCPLSFSTAGDTLRMDVVSPQQTVQSFPVAIFLQGLSTGTPPTVGSIPGFWLDPTQAVVGWSAADLTTASFFVPVPSGLAGFSLWFQAVSTAPTGTAAFPWMLSDGREVRIQ